MGLHRIKIGKGYILTGDDGLYALNKAFQEELERQLAELENKDKYDRIREEVLARVDKEATEGTNVQEEESEASDNNSMDESEG